MRRWLASLLAAGLAWSVAGCNTVDGMGKDLQAAGDAIRRAADRARH